MRRVKTAFLATISVILFNGSAATLAHSEEFATEFAVSAIGLPVGVLTFRSSIGDGAYTLNGKLRAAGVAALVTNINGTLTATGTYDENSVTATNFDTSYIEGKKSKSTKIAFKNGNVAKATSVPPVKKRGDWIELDAAHLRAVLDPISGVMIPSKSAGAVCDNTLKIFDGGMRSEYPMRYLRTIPFSAKGFKGDVVTCRAAFKPIAGYDRNKEDIKWMRENSYLDISFAPTGDTGLYSPVMAKIKTKIGLISIRARRFERLSK